MRGGYILEWLDTLVTVTFNPAKTRVAEIVPENIVKLHEQITIEKEKIQVAIKSIVFNIDDEAKIRCSIKKYHSSLIMLLDQALENKTQISKPAFLKPVLGSIISSIDELLSLIESRFITYLSIDERVPATYLAIAKKELSRKLAAITEKLHNIQSFQPAFSILKQEVEELLNYQPDTHAYTFQEILYLKDLCMELGRLMPIDEAVVYSSLDELLVSMNFNSKPYIYNLTQRVAAHVNSSEQTAGKMERLLFHLKVFKQFHRKPNVIFNAKDADLYKQVCNWFTQELFYLEKQIHYSIIPLKESAPKEVEKSKEKQKILSILSVDQMALVLRAADDMKIIMARSLNSVFKNIVPHLSTPYQEDISYDSMRSKSYSAEQRDKEIVIQTLQQMISKIKEY